MHALQTNYEQQDDAIDALVWRCIADSLCSQDFRDYLSHHPEGAAHIDEAYDRLIALDDGALESNAESRYPLARGEIEALAQSGNSVAQFHAGKLADLGVGGEKNDDRSMGWYRAAVLQGEFRSHVNLGIEYERLGTAERCAEARRLYQAASTAGEGVATFHLARMLRDGAKDQPEPNPALAFELLHLSWEQGNSVAGHWIGYMLGKGAGVRQDEALGKEWLVRAAEKSCTGAILSLSKSAESEEEKTQWLHRGALLGDCECQARYGLALLRGDGINKDGAQAVHWLKRAAVMNSAFAQRTLGLAYLWGVDVIRNATFGRRWLTRAAENDDAVAINQLARLLENDPEPDLLAAKNWYERAAKAGDADAQCALGVLYWAGRGTTADHHAARKWIHLAAMQGSPRGLYLLGRLHYAGVDGPADFAKAVDCFRQSAASGFGPGQAKLGWCYLKGEGVERDVAEGMLWLHKAAESGEAEASTTIGYVLRDGVGVEANAGEASKWFLDAAEKGDARGQYELAMLYAEGNGLQKNDAEARRWMEEAAALGDEDAVKWLKDAEITEATE